MKNCKKHISSFRFCSPSKGWIFSLVIYFLFAAINSNAQQEWLYTQSQFNIYDINGAYAGNYEELSVALRLREQWVGLEGAPSSQYLSMHLPVVQNLGAGLRVLNEKIGARSRQKITGSLAIKIPLKKGYIGFGFNAGLVRQQYLENIINLRDPADPSLSKIHNVYNAIHVDVAAIWYSKKYYLGVEIQNLNEPEFNSQAIIDFKQIRHLNLIGGYVFKLNDNFSIKPTAKAFVDQKVDLLLDVNLNFLIYEKVWLGAGVRKNLGFNFFAEWNVSRLFRFGYSYDLNNREGINGSHEIFLGYHLPFKNNTNSIRYFK